MKNRNRLLKIQDKNVWILIGSLIATILTMFNPLQVICYTLFFISFNLEIYLEIKLEGKGVKNYFLESGLIYGYWMFVVILVFFYNWYIKF